MYSPYGGQQNPPNAQQQQGGQQFYQQGPPAAGSGYFPPGQQAPPQQSPMGEAQQGAGTPMGGLTAGMGAMNMGGEPAASRPGKKKNRHAYHNLDQNNTQFPPSNGMPPGAGTPQFMQQPGTPQFMNQPGTPQFMNQPGTPGFQNQQVTPEMNQFPAQGGAYMPGQRPRMAPSHMSGQNIPQGTGVTTQGRVDPEQIPSVPRSRDDPAHYYLTNNYLTVEQHVPPPSVVPYTAYDQGNSSPKYARLTLNDIPATAEALNSTALPLGLVLQPLAPIAPGEYPIPVLDFGETGPPRCRRCRTYINPFMMFRSGGNKFVCNMCTFPNDVPAEYFAPTDMSGIRVDRDQRPELKLGTVEFVVPKEYWSKEPVGLRHLFVIDVSREALNRGLLQAFCDGILEALYPESSEEKVEGEPDVERAIPEGAKVGFVTFDRDAHFYNCSAGLSEAQMLVMPDIEDPFVPLGDEGLFVDPYESKAVIAALLKKLPTLFSNVQSPEPALLSALNAAMDALGKTGGKIIASISSLPTLGPGKLFMREDKNLQGIETEKKLFQTENANWKRTAAKMVEIGVGVDFFIAAPGGAYMDVATIGHVQAMTGGETFYYSNFVMPRDSLKVAQDVKHVITRETGYQALMKVRCSNGLQVSSYHGNFQQHTFGADLEFGTIDADKAVGVMFSYDGKLDAKLDAHFQCALLYTTASGERRVRCTNTVASVSEGAASCMRFIDQDAVVSMMAKDAATRMTERTLKDIRNAITEKTIDILAGYRKAYSSQHPSGQLVLPENLKEFSMYTLGLLKSRAFKGGQEPSDRRTHTMRLIRSCSAQTISTLLYPRIISLHDLPPEAGFPSSTTNQLVVPSSLRASFSRIQEGGAYLVSDGQITLIWLHAQVSPNLLEDLFGPGFDTLQSLPADLNALPILQTHLNAQTRNLLAYWGSTSGREAPPVQLARQGLDGAEYEFARLLVEDRNGEAQSYVDWLVQVHRGVQMELSGQRNKKERDAAEQDGALAGLRAMGW